MENEEKYGGLAVITGASSGIGFELAKQFARHGFDLLVTSHGTGLDSAVEEFRKFGTKVDSFYADLATFEGVESLAGKIEAMGVPVEAIAINAGVGAGGDFARDTNLMKELNLIQLNVVSTVHLAKRVLPNMIKQGRGKVLFTSSIAATMPGAFEAVYSASKAFVQSFSEAIREELKDTGVTVTALMPGATETNFFHRADLDDTKIGQSKKDDPAEVAEDGFRALMAGKDKVIAGSFKNKLFGAAEKILSDPARAKLHRQMSEPGSGRAKEDLH